MKKKTIYAVSVAAAGVLLLFIIFGIIINGTVSAQEFIFKGIYIEGTDVGGLKAEDALKLLEEKFNNPIHDKIISFKFEDKYYEYKFKDLNAQYDVNKAVVEALNFGKEGNILNKTIKRLKLKKGIQNIKLDFTADENVIKSIAGKIKTDIDKNPVDASIKMYDGKFKVIKDIPGRGIEEDKFISIVKDNLKPDYNGETLSIPVKVIEAQIKGDAISSINTKISNFSTKLYNSSENRVENIRLAVKAINGTVVMPDEVFSILKELGPITTARGYKDAPMMVSGDIIPGVGGGVCQVSTTLYNTVLLANLEIVQRKNHSLPISYVSVGRDATIASNSLDFKFKNTNKNPIYIEAYIANRNVNINFYGTNERPGEKIEIFVDIYERIKPVIETKYDPNMPENQKKVIEKAADGFRVKTYRKVYMNGVLIKTQFLSNDYYRPVNGLIMVGTKKTDTNPGGNVTP